VLEALRSGRDVIRLWVLDAPPDGSLREILALARRRQVPVTKTSRAALDRMGAHTVHQGVVAEVGVKATVGWEVLEDEVAQAPHCLIYVADGIQDPQNLGALLRVADATGATAVVIGARQGVGLTAAVAKASAGAIEYVPVVRVGNLARATARLKELGVFVYGADPQAHRLYSEVDWRGKIAVVVGAEGRGVRPLVLKTCDGTVRLPMQGRVGSLNVAAAAAVLGFEAVRQRLADAQPQTRG
jgi:23S rRNA (guanosine2251-2'-O)-methyltransferase